MDDFMTVAELLKLPSLPGLELIAGKNGAGRRVSTVTVVDTPDGAKWIKGGEFVITTAFAVKDDNALLTELLFRLHKSGAAALGIKMGRFIQNIPDDTLRAADLLSFPLVLIPEKFAFCDLINPVLSIVVNRQSVYLMRANKIRAEFLELAVNDSGAAEIIKRLGAMIERGAAFADVYSGKCYFSGDGGAFAGAVAGGCVNGVPSDGLPYKRLAVANKSEMYGYIIIDAEKDEELDEITRSAIEYATIVLIVCMQKVVSNQRIENKYKALFLEDLLTNNVKTDNEIHNRAKLYGWNFANGGLVAIVDINNIKKYYNTSLDSELNDRLEEAVSLIFGASIECMSAEFPGVKYYKQSDLICFIITPETRNFDRNGTYGRLERVFDELRGRIAGLTHFTVTLGVGDYFPSIRDIHTSYAQARTSIQFGYQLERFDCILFYTKMGVYRLLAEMSGTREAEEFVGRLIEPLIQYDAKNNSTLVSTLDAVIKAGWNLKNASAALFIHYNSVKYRFAKICELLSVDPHDHEQCMELELAYKLYLVMSHKWKP